MPTAEELIQFLDLKPLPEEGGYYRETWRSAQHIPGASGSSDTSVGTAIYYLLTPDTFSALHRLPTDEVYHFYLGDPVQMLLLKADGTGEAITLGSDILEGQLSQFVVPAQTWQGSSLVSGGKAALLGTTMAPGFDFTDYEGGEREKLLTQYPDFKDLIERLTPLG